MGASDEGDEVSADGKEEECDIDVEDKSGSACDCKGEAEGGPGGVEVVCDGPGDGKGRKVREAGGQVCERDAMQCGVLQPARMAKEGE